MKLDPTLWADKGLLDGEILPPCDRRAFSTEELCVYVRAAYAHGYVAALRAETPLPLDEAGGMARALLCSVPVE